MMDREMIVMILDEIRELSSLYTKQAASRMKVCQLTPDQTKLLLKIDQGTMSQRQLAEFMHISEATLSVRMKKLEQLGYVTRETEADDKRKHRLALTKKGQDALEEAIQLFLSYHEEMLSKFTDKDIAEVVRLFNLLRSGLLEFDQKDRS